MRLKLQRPGIQADAIECLFVMLLPRMWMAASLTTCKCTLPVKLKVKQLRVTTLCPGGLLEHQQMSPQGLPRRQILPAAWSSMYLSRLGSIRMAVVAQVRFSPAAPLMWAASISSTWQLSSLLKRSTCWMRSCAGPSTLAKQMPCAVRASATRFRKRGQPVNTSVLLPGAARWMASSSSSSAVTCRVASGVSSAGGLEDVGW
jgi:hypothetical protein